jgi:hypothetical protein
VNRAWAFQILSKTQAGKQHYIERIDRLFYKACHVEFLFKFLDEMANERQQVVLCPIFEQNVPIRAKKLSA